MGYYSRVEGELRFSKPLTKGQLDDAMYAVKRDVTRSTDAGHVVYYADGLSSTESPS